MAEILSCGGESLSYDGDQNLTCDGEIVSFDVESCNVHRSALSPDLCHLKIHNLFHFPTRIEGKKL